MLATVPQLLLALVLAQLLNQRLRGRDCCGWACCCPNITSVAAVGIIFTLLFARDFGLVNWLLGHRRRRARSTGRTTAGRRGWRSR